MYTNNTTLLFNDIKLGKPQAYEYVFKTYYPRLRAYAMRFVVQPDDLDDILQDCFSKLWENRCQLSNISISSLLFTMVRNACLNFLRHRLITQQQSLDDIIQQKGSEQLYSLTFHQNPEEELVYEELLRKIHEVLDDLPLQSKQIFKMSRGEGLKNREIAEKLGVSIKTVEYHITKTLDALRKFSGKYTDQTFVMLLIIKVLLSQ